MLSPIHTNGNKFYTAEGQVFKYVGVSAFALFKRWLAPSGPDYLVAPILAEWRKLAATGGYTGPIVLRVFRYAGNNNAFAIDPWSYAMSEATKFTQFCGERGFYVDWTTGDSQLIIPEAGGPKGQQQHLNEFCAAMVPCTNAFVQTCNEPFQNGIDLNAVKPPKWGTYLRSSGYYYTAQEWDHAYDLDFTDYHSDRGTEGDVAKWVGEMFMSAMYLASPSLMHGLPVVFGEPMGADEIDKPGRRSNDPLLFRKAGLIIGFLAGATFHSTAGLSSDGLGPVQSACAANWFYGINQGLTV